MEIKVIKNDGDEMEFSLKSLTLVELLRVYLNKDPSVVFSAWKREHPTEQPIIKVKTKGKTAKKALINAIDSITKDLVKIEKDFESIK